MWSTITPAAASTKTAHCGLLTACCTATPTTAFTSPIRDRLAVVIGQIAGDGDVRRRVGEGHGDHRQGNYAMQSHVFAPLRSAEAPALRDCTRSWGAAASGKRQATANQRGSRRCHCFSHTSVAFRVLPSCVSTQSAVIVFPSGARLDVRTTFQFSAAILCTSRLSFQLTDTVPDHGEIFEPLAVANESS